jgi:hypothetical protein
MLVMNQKTSGHIKNRASRVYSLHTVAAQLHLIRFHQPVVKTISPWDIPLHFFAAELWYAHSMDRRDFMQTTALATGGLLLSFSYRTNPR